MTETPSRRTDAPRGPDPDLPGSVGRYRIIRRLGEGGMGSVYLAMDTVLRREVALKLPLSGTENDPEVRERFLREARSAATLDHPYICRVYDADVADGRLYLAMAYVEGQSLAELVRSEGMPPRQVVALVGKLAIALSEAHAKGVVHRDLKPRNVMIRAVGSKREPVIVDFGLARLDSPEDARMTRTGQVMGTPAYMAPEQLRGDPGEIGPACDIYALGVVLYELLTGRLPFVGSYPVLMAQILTQPPPPPSAHRAGLDPALDAICLKAMAKEASGRYGSMMELATALTGYLKGAPTESISGVRVAPIARPAEGDSIPTGADTLVSQLLKPAGDGAAPSHLGIDLGTPQDSSRSRSPRATKAAAQPPPSDSPDESTGRKPRWLIPVAAATVGVLLLAAIIVVVTNKGRVTIEVQDPASVAIDGQEIRVTVEGEPIVLRAGEHSLEVKWKDGHFETEKFEIKRGETTPLLVTYRPQGDKARAADTGRPLRLGVVDPPKVKGTENDAAAGGFKPLFNGKDLSGWTIDGDNQDGWSVASGTIVARGEDARSRNYLLTDRDYGDFILQLEYIQEEKGSAGIALRGLPGERLPMSDDTFIFDHPLLKLTDGRVNEPTGTLHWVLDRLYVIPGVPARVNAAGEWNRLRIEVKGHKVRFSVNDEEILNTIIDASASFPDGLTPALNRVKGRVGLQKHTGTVRFRNIEIQDLGQPAPVADAGADGFQPLFNGKDLAGWKTHPRQPGDWLIEDGVLVGRNGPSHLFTDREDFDNFHLRVEARINGTGNSGVYFRSEYGLSLYGKFPKGYEAQIASDFATAGGKYRTGSLFDLAPVEAQLVPPGTWFVLEVIADGNQIVIKVDGKEASRFVDAGRLYSRGCFALQCLDLDTKIEFRRIEIKGISPGTAGNAGDQPARASGVSDLSSVTQPLAFRFNVRLISKIKEARALISQLDPINNVDKLACKVGALEAIQRAEAAINANRSPSTDLAKAKIHLEELFRIGAKNANARLASSALRLIDEMQKAEK